MNKPELYHRVNQMQREDAKWFIQEFRSQLQWKLNGADRIMDIGCGPGDVTIDLLEPILPSNYEKLVGIDISSKMLNFATNTYCKNYPKVEFQYLDIQDNFIPKNYLEHFDHITSFYCLHWIQEQR